MKKAQCNEIIKGYLEDYIKTSNLILQEQDGQNIAEVLNIWLKNKAVTITEMLLAQNGYECMIVTAADKNNPVNTWYKKEV